MTKPDVSLAAVIGVAHQSHGGDVNAKMILVEGGHHHRGGPDRVGQGADHGV